MDLLHGGSGCHWLPVSSVDRGRLAGKSSDRGLGGVFLPDTRRAGIPASHHLAAGAGAFGRPDSGS